MDKPMFQVVDGTEQYRVIDLTTGAESFYTDKVDAYKMAAFIAHVRGHKYQIEDRVLNWYSIGGQNGRAA